MYDNWSANLTVVAVTLVTVSLAVLTHYEGLLFVSGRLQRAGGPRRAKVLYGILSMLALHVVEIWLFGVAAWLLLQWPACGHVAMSGVAGTPAFFDVIYLSAITFTTVGFGDLTPVGPIRFLSGTEALTGFVLIGWSASFTYLEMERFWRNS
jgi:Ion channel